MKKIFSILASSLASLTLALTLAACAQPAAPVEKAQPTAQQPTPAAPAAKAEAAKPTPAPPKPTEPAKPQQMVKVRIGLQAVISDAAVYVADGKGYFKEQAIELDIANMSPAEMVPLLATGQLDAAGVLGNAAYYNALARGAVLKGVADKGRFSKGNGTNGLLVRKDLVDQGKYKGLTDLKGMKVALTPPPMASVSAYNLDSALQTVGLTLKDIEMVGLALPDMPGALAGKSIDAAASGEPYIVRAVEIGAAVRVMGWDVVNPDHQLTGISYSEAFTRDKPDVAKRFMVAYVKGARDYNDAFVKNKGKAEILKILAQATTVKEVALWEKMVPAGLNPDGYLNVDSLMNQVDWMLKNGQIQERPKPEQFIDNQYVDYAISVLGKYQ